MTALLPFSGGVVEVEAALYRASSGGPVETAVAIAGELASLIGPPLSTAAVVAEKVSAGLDAVLAKQGDDPVLGVHWSMSTQGGGGHVLRPGHLAVVNAAEHELPGPLRVVDGRLSGPDGLLTGCRAPRFPTTVLVGGAVTHRQQPPTAGGVCSCRWRTRPGCSTSWSAPACGA